MSHSSRPPRYSRQRRSGKSDSVFTRLNGQKVYLGRYGSPESRAKYRQLLNRDESEPTESRQGGATATLAMVMVAYLEHSERYYRQPDGTPGREYGLIREVLRYVRKGDTSIEAAEFGPKRLKAIRKELIDAGLSKIFINKQVARLARMFKWAASDELIPGSVHTNLKTLEGLKRGRSDARETTPRRPVNDADVEATLEHLPQVVADMVRLQRLTGMRGGELVQIRPCDLDRSGKVWFYRTARHKTQHQGRSRVVAIGPKSQEILLSYLARDEKMYCFRPCDSEEKRRAIKTAERVIPLEQGNTPGSNRKEKPLRTAGEMYSVDSYRRSINRACQKAGVSPWSPHQLRHSSATEVRREFGLEAAQVVLGHAQASITEVYAERDEGLAAKVALKIG